MSALRTWKISLSKYSLVLSEFSYSKQHHFVKLLTPQDWV